MQRITRRKLLNYFGAAALASACLGVASSRGQSATPKNILLIAADDLGPYLGCYGDEIARTPNLDTLASQGIRFANSFVTNASCSSSRSSLFTGLYPHQTGYFQPDNTPVGQIGLAYVGSRYGMDPSVITMPQLLKMAGYRTGLIGKLHIFPEASFPWDYYKSQETTNMRDVELVAQRAGSFLAQQPQQPFFLTVCYGDPHEPFFTQVNGYPQLPFGPTDVPPFPWTGLEDTPERREKMAGYYNGIARLDAGIGMLLDQLAQSGLAKNTIVIFIGDHGPPFRRGKLTCYEAGLRIPLLVSWPGRISPNMVNKSLVSTVDIMPTVLKAAGLPVPQNLAGRSLMPLFQGDTANWRGILYGEYTSHERKWTYFKPSRCVRGRRYKYILKLLPQESNPSGEELYDLYADPYEFNNLAGIPEHQDQKDSLSRGLFEWRQQTADPLLDPAVLAAMVEEHRGL